MARKKHIVVSAVAAASMLLSSSMPALAVAEESFDREKNVITGIDQLTGSANIYASADASVGQFAWDQTSITSTSVIREVFRAATSALCNATDDFAMSNPLQWKLSISGAVDNTFTATIDELAQEQAVQQAMTCSCGGNPSDGKAIITADVKGIPLSYLLDRAGVHRDANTITFVSSDGTEVAMPLMYAVGRHGVISFEINGEDLSASVGGNNQLWLAGASANYFVRDISEIRVTCEEVVPPKPGEGLNYPNSPNVGILSSSVQ